MNVLGIASMALSAVVSSGVGAVVGNAIKASTPANATALKRVTIGVGGFVLSSMAGQQALAHTGQQLEQIGTHIQGIKSAVKNEKTD